MKFLIAVAVSCITLTTFSQNPTSIWYFGEFAGLDFRMAPPLALLNGQLNSIDGESSATISSDEGNLLFYTDGVSVYNRSHQPMQNGTNLWGHPSTTQTLIVPQPGNDSIFYIFTNSPQYNTFAGTDSVGCHYSIVNLANNNGLGAVIEKNTLLFKKTTEKVAAVHHVNGTDIWVVFHEWESNCFRSYLVTAAGIEFPPVVSCIGSIHQGGGPAPGINENFNAAGQMKISSDGSLLALVLTDSRRVEVFFLTTKPAG
ncbi:MAG: hypothetical protein HRU69_05630 [Flammeovirgaceae bacterium]|nr:MAG: hypothetical protein HRU69_05630 [Flammeovirgaceae bacterium]